MFHIHSISDGWIIGQISDGDKTHYFDYSYITNFLDDFMLALLTVGGHWSTDERKHRFRTELEPGIEYWTLSKVQDKLHIHIETYEDSHTEEPYKEVLLVCEYHKFLEDFIAEMERVLSVFGLLGYRVNWSYEFPISVFLKLKDNSKVESTLSYGTLSAENNVGSEVQVTNFTSEWKLLNRT